jgi:hypothetical protein
VAGVAVPALQLLCWELHQGLPGIAAACVVLLLLLLLLMLPCWLMRLAPPLLPPWLLPHRQLLPQLLRQQPWLLPASASWLPSWLPVLLLPLLLPPQRPTAQQQLPLPWLLLLRQSWPGYLGPDAAAAAAASLPRHLWQLRSGLPRQPPGAPSLL